MWSLASLVLAFCLCASAQISPDIEPWVWIKGRYEDLEDTQLNFIQVFERSRIGVYASANFNLFFPGEDEVFAGFSYNFDQLTHNISSYLVQWNIDEETFEEAGVQPDDYNNDNGNVNSNSYGETFSSINYFTTADGETWAYHAFVHADDVNERYPDPITFRGDSLLYRWDGSAFETEATYRVYSQQASTRSQYFITPDGREFLWTANFELPYYLSGTPNCTLHEYGNGGDGSDDTTGGWRQVAGSNFNGNNNNNGFGYYNCSKFPRAPLAFTTVDDEWLYLDVAYATATWKADGSLGTMNTVAVPQNKWWTQRTTTGASTYGFDYADVMDNFALTNVNTVDHFQDAGYDYIVAMSDAGIITYRMHWVTHRAQELPVLVSRPVRPPTHMWLFTMTIKEDEVHQCMSVSYGPFTGLNAVTSSVQDTFFSIYCWDTTHDRWNLVVKVPSFGVIKTQTFVSDDRLFLVALQNVGHPTMNTFTTYEIEDWYDDEYLITREVEPDSYELYKKIVDIHEELDDLHHYKAMIIATLSLLATFFILQLILLVKGL